MFSHEDVQKFVEFLRTRPPENRFNLVILLWQLLMSYIDPTRKAVEAAEQFHKTVDYNLLIGCHGNWGPGRHRQVIANLVGLVPGLVLVLPKQHVNTPSSYDCGFLLRDANGYEVVYVGEYPLERLALEESRKSLADESVRYFVGCDSGQSSDFRYIISTQEWNLLEPFLAKWLPAE